jgi:raffinose synthase
MPSQRLLDLVASATVRPDATATGVLIDLTTEAKPTARQVLPLGRFSAAVSRWTCCRRINPYWMHAEWGDGASAVPRETQFLLAELTDGRLTVIVPLPTAGFRCSLEGYGGEVQVLAESGDPSLVTSALAATVFIAEGADLAALMTLAAKAVIAHLGTGRLRRDKPLPAFIDQFGWCTWDAFYQEVSAEKVRAGLESFKAIGIQPKLLILDDGWQSERPAADGSRRLYSLLPNAKFGGDLSPLVREAKGEFGIETFLVWHAFMGYWGGIEPEALPAYGARLQPRVSSPGILHYVPDHDRWFGPSVGVPDATLAYRFYHDYHRTLRGMGVDGVKVDAQGTTETVAIGQGGRVNLMQRLHEGLEGAVQVHFRGNLINCMSCSSEMLYSALNSTITRTSDDFWPKKPETHARHVITNAWVGLWFGEFVHPDWDMFHSKHPAGDYHGAARAVSGSPLYVSDKPGEHGPELLLKLVFSDGGAARCLDPGTPARRSVFVDPTVTPEPLLVINRTATNGVVGAFNGQYHADAAQQVRVTGSVSAADLPSLANRPCVGWSHRGQRASSGAISIELGESEADVVTFAPIEHGLAVFGLARLFAPGTAVRSASWNGRTWVGQVRDGGEFVAWAEQTPTAITLDGKPLAFTHVAGVVRTTLPTAGELRITLG